MEPSYADIERLLEPIHKRAKDEDLFEYGLPLSNKAATDDLVNIVRLWLAEAAGSAKK